MKKIFKIFSTIILISIIIVIIIGAIKMAIGFNNYEEEFYSISLFLSGSAGAIFLIEKVGFFIIDMWEDKKRGTGNG